MPRLYKAAAALLAAVLPLLFTVPPALAQTSDPVAPAPAATGSLQGQVLDQNGHPVSGTEVELIRYPVGRVAMVPADAAGYFRFAGLEDGVYWVRAWAPDHGVAEAAYVPGSQEPFLALSLDPISAVVAGQVLDARTGKPVAQAAVSLVQAGVGLVDAGESRTDGHFSLAGPGGEGYALQVAVPGYQPRQVELPALTGGEQSDITVELEPATARVGAVVISNLGSAPLRSTRVRVIRSGFGVVAEAYTDAEGQIDLTLPATGTVAGESASDGSKQAEASFGTYQLEITPPQHQFLRTDTFALEGGIIRSFAGAERLAVDPIQARVTGRVLKVDGKGDRDVEVILEQEGVGVVDTTETALDGTFGFSGIHVLPGARYRVRVLGHEIWRTGAATEWMELQPGESRQVTLQFKTGHNDEYPEGSLRVAVTDPAGRPVSGAQVELWRDGYGRVDAGPTDGGGQKLFARVRANEPPEDHWWAQKGNGYVVRVKKDGYYEMLVGDPTLDVRQERETMVNVVLYPTAVPVSGRVADPDGQPVAGAKVTLFPEGGGLSLESRTDELGAFRLDQVSTARRWTLKVEAEGYWSGVGPGVLDLNPAQGSVVNVTLYPKGAQLQGRVGDHQGRAVTGVEVTAIDPAGERYTARTLANGRFELTGLPAGVPLLLQVGPPEAGQDDPEGDRPAFPGVTWVAAVAAGAAPAGAGPAMDPAGRAVAPVSLRPGEHRTLDLALYGGAGTVAGTVMAPGGEPRSGVRVALIREGQGVVAAVRTDLSGQYRFEGVPANPAGGRYLVRVVDPDQGYREVGNPGPPGLFRVKPGQVVSRHLVVTPLR